MQAHREIIQLPHNVKLQYYCWNPLDLDKPVMLLTHGTGFVAANFDALARYLKSQFRLVSYDRRGHGLSAKPNHGYKLMDFANDSIALCEALNLKDIYGVGHSAGATDLLIAESLKPGLFKQLFVMEPTINDPSQPSVPREQAFNAIKPRIDQALKRRSHFPSRENVLDNYRTKPLFERWQALALETYIDFGFREDDNGGVTLQCRPEIEAQILTEIFFAFQNTKFSNGSVDPFRRLNTIKCPLAVSESHYSAPQFKQLTQRFLTYFPNAKHVKFKFAGHCVPQEDPQTLAQEALTFWQENH